MGHPRKQFVNVEARFLPDSAGAFNLPKEPGRDLLDLFRQRFPARGCAIAGAKTTKIYQEARVRHAAFEGGHYGALQRFDHREIKTGNFYEGIDCAHGRRGVLGIIWVDIWEVLELAVSMTELHAVGVFGHPGRQPGNKSRGT